VRLPQLWADWAATKLNGPRGQTRARETFGPSVSWLPGLSGKQVSYFFFLFFFLSFLYLLVYKLFQIKFPEPKQNKIKPLLKIK
jgi:hypothetical protein